ncbi:2-amino-4-hydroxy-6-hydroxymethyldihydropteridine diphosphokinase [candidate division KSB1 bacterium]|nr:2-amino-4-hydroxy-6-hydroxymethyldihydropteridine diphosphokinase [candidate division KSB1 bacterium]
MKFKEQHDLQSNTHQRVFLSLGTNINKRLEFLRSAIEKIHQLAATRIVSVSSIYETEPHGVAGQPDFLNAALEIRTGLCPVCLLFSLQRIENQLGRYRTVPWGPRTIDIDIIYFGALVRNTPLLTIPHPRTTTRKFVLQPLNEIAPDFLPPQADRAISFLCENCPDLHHVVKLSEPVLLVEEQSD